MPASDASLGLVVAGDLLVIAGVADVLVLVELGGLPDLVRREADVDLALGLVDRLHGSGGQQDVLAEDPHAGVDDEVRGGDVVRVLVGLTDAAVGGFDRVSDQLGARGSFRYSLLLPQLNCEVVQASSNSMTSRGLYAPTSDTSGHRLPPLATACHRLPQGGPRGLECETGTTVINLRRFVCPAKRSALLWI